MTDGFQGEVSFPEFILLVPQQLGAGLPHSSTSNIHPGNSDNIMAQFNICIYIYVYIYIYDLYMYMYIYMYIYIYMYVYIYVYLYIYIYT